MSRVLAKIDSGYIITVDHSGSSSTALLTLWYYGAESYYFRTSVIGGSGTLTLDVSRIIASYIVHLFPTKWRPWQNNITEGMQKAFKDIRLHQKKLVQKAFLEKQANEVITNYIEEEKILSSITDELNILSPGNI